MNGNINDLKTAPFALRPGSQRMIILADHFDGKITHGSFTLFPPTDFEFLTFDFEFAINSAIQMRLRDASP
jgi:hypothetical protein